MITLHKDEWHSKDQGKPMYFFKCGNHAGILFSAIIKNEFLVALEDYIISLKMSPHELSGDMILSEQTMNYINTSDAASVLGKKGGSAKSDAKKKSSAKNGKLGGRPKGSCKKKVDDR